MKLRTIAVVLTIIAIAVAMILSASVAGPDVDSNGVRDDVEAYIFALDDAEPQKAALTQMSVAIRSAMTSDRSRQGDVDQASRAIAAATSCISARYDPLIAGMKSSSIEKLMVNSRDRYWAYRKFNSALNGRRIVHAPGDGCIE